MNKEAQRIAIAEACGLRIAVKVGQPAESGLLWPPTLATQRRLRWPSACVVEYIPDYLNDLNAMHEAERVLNRVQRVQFYNYLGDVLRRESPVNDVTEFDRIHAKAELRAEAFLRTIGKWDAKAAASVGAKQP